MSQDHKYKPYTRFIYKYHRSIYKLAEGVRLGSAEFLSFHIGDKIIDRGRPCAFVIVVLKIRADGSDEVEEL